MELIGNFFGFILFALTLGSGGQPGKCCDFTLVFADFGTKIKFVKSLILFYETQDGVPQMAAFTQAL